MLSFSPSLSDSSRVFPRPPTHGGGGQVQEDKDLMGGTHGGHRPYGGDLTLIDYIIN